MSISRRVTAFIKASDRVAAAALRHGRDEPCALAGRHPVPGRCPAAVEDGARQCRARTDLQWHGAQQSARRGGIMARAAGSGRLRGPLSPSLERRSAQARRARAGVGDAAQADPDGRAVRLSRCDRGRSRGEGRRRAGRARGDQCYSGHPRSRGGAQPLRRSLPAVAGAACTHHSALPRADSAAARSRAFPHASRLRTALREALGGPLPRSRSPGGGGMMLLDPRYAWIRQLVAFAILLAVWEVAGRMDLLNPLYVPNPSRIGAALVDLFSDGSIWPHLDATFTAALGGLALGIAVGILLGVVAALVRLIAELIEPVMTVLNAIPRVILAPLFVIWLGIGLASKVALSFILVAVLIFFTVFSGIRQVDRRLVERVITLGGNRWSLVRHVYLPSVTAWVLGNLKIAVGFAFTGACVGEFVAATHGLGYLLSFAQSTYNAALMFALILLILVVVLVIFGIAGRMERYLLRWN